MRYCLEVYTMQATSFSYTACERYESFIFIPRYWCGYGIVCYLDANKLVSINAYKLHKERKCFILFTGE